MIKDILFGLVFVTLFGVVLFAALKGDEEFECRQKIAWLEQGHKFNLPAECEQYR